MWSRPAHRTVRPCSPWSGATRGRPRPGSPSTGGGGSPRPSPPSAARRFADRHGPARPGEELVHRRFWTGADSYQGPGPARNLLAATGTLEWLTNPRLAWSFLTVADPDAWHPVMTYLNQRRAAEADFEVGGRHYAVYAHDWRAEPPLAWLDRMAERELSDQRVEALEAELPAPLLVLSEPSSRRPSARPCATTSAAPRPPWPPTRCCARGWPPRRRAAPRPPPPPSGPPNASACRSAPTATTWPAGCGGSPSGCGGPSCRPRRLDDCFRIGLRVLGP
jgi:hypothetical protein